MTLPAHLDGHSLVIRPRHNEVVSPGERWRLLGEGMPKVGSSDRGALIVKFEVRFPSATMLASRTMGCVAEAW